MRKSLAERAIELDCSHHRPPIQQGTGKCPVSRADLEDKGSFHVGKVRNALHGEWIDKEVLIVIRFHFEVNT
jgi:hypothetical protein